MAVMQLMDSPTYRLSLAKRLERERAAKNNGTIPGGLAYMLDSARAGYQRYRDEQDRTGAMQAFRAGMGEGAPMDGVGRDAQQPNAPQQQPGIDAVMSRLSGMEDNPYAGRLSMQLAMTQAEQRQQQEALRDQRQWQQQQTMSDRDFRREMLGAQQQFQRSMQRPQTSYELLPPDQVEQLGLPPGSYMRASDGRIQQVAQPQTPDYPSSVQEYNFAVQNGFGGSFQDWVEGEAKAGATKIDMKGESKFSEVAGAETAKMFSGLAQQGVTAKANIGTLRSLEDLLGRGVGGTADAWRSWAQNRLGVNIGAGGEVEAVNALINRLVPEQRPAGSGPMSDADLELFKQSLPSLINSPQGNQIILNTMQALANYQAETGDIAQQALIGRISREEAFDRLSQMPNPMAPLKSALGDNGGRQRNQGGDIGNGIRSMDQPEQPKRRRYNPQTGRFEEVR